LRSARRTIFFTLWSISLLTLFFSLLRVSWRICASYSGELLPQADQIYTNLLVKILIQMLKLR
jgi:hypothetical protein